MVGKVIRMRNVPYSGMLTADFPSPRSWTSRHASEITRLRGLGFGEVCMEKGENGRGLGCKVSGLGFRV